MKPLTVGDLFEETTTLTLKDFLSVREEYEELTLKHEELEDNYDVLDEDYDSLRQDLEDELEDCKSKISEATQILTAIKRR